MYWNGADLSQNKTPAITWRLNHLLTIDYYVFLRNLIPLLTYSENGNKNT